MSNAKRHVLTVADINKANGSLTVPANTIVTPSAYDCARLRGVTIVRESKPPAVSTEPEPKPEPTMDSVQLARCIDHTNLSPTATHESIVQLCNEAIEHGFATVCINPTRVALAVELCAESRVQVCSVVGFPTGAHHTDLKMREAEQAITDGAKEIDMVANSGLLLDDDITAYAADIRAVRLAIGEQIILKVIIEASQLTESDIVRAAVAAEHAGANYVKTSTGVYGKACREDVSLMRRVLSDSTKIKAAGGITTAQQALDLLKAGADRLGMSQSVAVMIELRRTV